MTPSICSRQMFVCAKLWYLSEIRKIILMGYETKIACASVFVLTSIIWYQRKKIPIKEKSDNDREEMTTLFEKIEEMENEKSILTEENNDLKKLVRDDMTWFSEQIQEKENEIRNLTEENDDLRKLASEQSKELSDFFDCQKRLIDAENLIADQKRELSEAKNVFKKLKLLLEVHQLQGLSLAGLFLLIFSSEQVKGLLKADTLSQTLQTDSEGFKQIARGTARIGNAFRIADFECTTKILGIKKYALSLLFVTNILVEISEFLDNFKKKKEEYLLKKLVNFRS